MAAIGESDARTLAELRSKIDQIDEAIHRLLIDRSTVIESLIAAKGTQINKAAFRPQREAEMMRRIASRHSGELPLATVEHLWREIITTFTFMQAPFRVVVDYGTDQVAIHDLARFAFGFSVAFVTASDPGDVIARVAESGTDLGLIPAARTDDGDPWWRRLSAASGPRLMAVLPFIATEGRTASAPAFVISPLLAEATPPDLRVFAVRTNAAGEAALMADHHTAVIAATGPAERRELMLALTDGADEEWLHLHGAEDVTAIGGIARGIADQTATALRAPLRTGSTP